MLLVVETLLFGFSKNFVYYPLAVSGFCWFVDSVLNLFLCGGGFFRMSGDEFVPAGFINEGRRWSVTVQRFVDKEIEEGGFVGAAESEVGSLPSFYLFFGKPGFGGS